MVIPDWTAPQASAQADNSVPHPSSSVELARPLDRLAAVIVDVFVLLVPVYILLSAPFKRGLTANFILGAEPEFLGLMVCMVGLGVALVVLYQGLMHYFFGATMGKMLFDLRVQPVFRESRVTLPGSFARSAIWLFETALLGIPFLAVFSNAKRRTLHDRICDTVVVSISGPGVREPGQIERGMVRGLFAACLLFLFTIGVYQARGVFSRLRTEKGLTSIIEKDTAQCPIVGEYVDREGEDEVSEHHRLQLAMSLYAAGLADRTCLESEVEGEMANQVPIGPLTYLAQAFINSDDAEVSNSYLDQVCEDAAGSVECSMSRVVSSWSEDDWETVEKILTSAEKGSGYLEVWGVRHFMKAARYDQALAFLDSLIGHRELAEFSLSERVKALYNHYSASEANAALAQALPTLPKDDGDELSAWVCAQELQKGCGALEELACHDVAHIHQLNEIDFTHSAQALAQIMSLECSGGQAVDYLTFSEAVRDEDWQVFFRANMKEQKDDHAAAFELYSSVLRSPDAPDLLRIEALRRSAQFASAEQLASMTDIWEEIESKEIWVKTGNLLFARLAQLQDQDGALRVARHLVSSEALSPGGTTLLTSLVQMESQRAPASVNARGRKHKEGR